MTMPATTYASLTPAQGVAHAAREGVTNLGQLSRAQVAALRRAVKAGTLTAYPSVWGDRPTYGPPLPDAPRATG